MNWLWLTGSAVLLFGFIMLVLNVLPTIAANWQLIRSGVRWLRPKHPVVAAEPKDETQSPTPVPVKPRYLPPAPRGMPSSPRYRSMRPDYRYTGGAVTASATMYDETAYLESMTSRPDSDRYLRWPRVSESGPNGTGTGFRS